MKQICFIRHLRTEDGMGNHAALPLTTLQNLATHVISPNIDESKFSAAKEFLQREGIRKVSKILHSRIKRTKQTALLLAEELTCDKSNIQEVASLDEMFFQPAQLITENEWKEVGMEKLRMAVYKATLTGKGAESVTSIYKRMYSLEKKLQSGPEESIICVTHGFYMRFLEIYFSKGKKDEKSVTITDINNATIFDYGTGFTVTI